MSDEWEWPERAVERLDAGDLEMIKEAGDGWVARHDSTFDGSLQGSERAAFIAGAAWAMQYRWDE